MFDGFDGRKFVFTNPIHQFPRTITFVYNFLNFRIKEGSLDVLNYLLETLPIVETSCRSIVIGRTTTLGEQLHSSIHHCLECLEIFDFLAFFVHAWSIIAPS